ncbi:MAG: adenylyl-sulfate kinase [Armatimonadetes bacterium]|nr:adenylyl-sulfate kinase [Armatimonadota bacterium]
MPQREKGAVIWFTGLAGSGKSTIASGVVQRLADMGLDVENLDADIVRANLSPNLGFSLEARDENTKRLAWLAQLLSKYGVNVVIAAVATLRYFRDRARQWCEKFVEVYVDAPLEVCMQRDPKGLYARAARGEVHDVDGIHIPYEEPLNPEVHLRTDQMSIEECVEAVMNKLFELGYVNPPGAQSGDSPPASASSDDGYTDDERRKVEERLRGLGYV